MEMPKRRYTNAGGMTKGKADVEFYNFRTLLDEDLVSLKCASMVLNIKLQAVSKLGLPRYLVEKKAVYKKGDIQAVLTADHAEPNRLLRDLQEQHRRAQIKQNAHPSRRYQPADGSLLPEEAQAAKATSMTNRGKPPTKDELARRPWGWGSFQTVPRRR